MGQARARGTREERVSMALLKRGEEMARQAELARLERERLDKRLNELVHAKAVEVAKKDGNEPISMEEVENMSERRKRDFLRSVDRTTNHERTRGTTSLDRTRSIQQRIGLSAIMEIAASSIL